MSKNSSVKYYQVNGERLQKKLMKNIFWKRSLSQEKIFQKMKKTSCLSIEKKCY